MTQLRALRSYQEQKLKRTEAAWNVILTLFWCGLAVWIAYLGSTIGPTP